MVQNRRSEEKKKRKLHPFLEFLNGVITLFLVGVVAFVAGIYFIQYQFTKTGPLEYSTVVVIPKGMSTTSIADRLQSEGIIEHKLIFMLSWYFVHKTPSLKAGEYAVSKGASVNDVIAQLGRGRAILHKITIPEGFTSYMVVKRINTHPNLSGKINEIPEEGSLLPDTYVYSRNTDRNDIIKRMQAEQSKFLSKVWKRRVNGLPIKSPEEALILASIVEKETGSADERDQVAAVFINRLRKGWKLESDPTIIYGIAKGKGRLGGPILRSQKNARTEYNTYFIKGLPPTPIANPGRDAIEAVLNPATSENMFFVADGTGGHIFAKTYSQHKKNVKEWRKIEKRIRKKQAEKKAAKLLAEKAKQVQANQNIPGVNITSGTSVEPAAQSGDLIPLPTRNER